MPLSIVLPAHSKLNQTIIDELDDLFDFVPPGKLSRKLRNIFLSYVRYETEMLPPDINDTIAEMMLLLDFLDSSSDQIGDKANIV